MADEGREVENDRPPLIPQTHPWLLLSHGQDYQRQAFYSISESRSYTREIPMLRKKIPLCSCYGWLVNQDMETHNCYLFNPVSMENIELPPTPLDNQTGKKGLLFRAVVSKPPTDPDCHILIIFPSYSIAFCKLGDKRFAGPETGSNWDHNLRAVIALKGKIYGLTISYTFVTVEIVNSAVQIIPLIKDGLTFQINNPLPPENHIFDCYLVESGTGDEFLFVYLIYSSSYSCEVTRFKVFRVNTCAMTCEELNSIGDGVIFLSDQYYGMCFKAGPGVRANCIYYAKSKDNRLYVHNLEDRSRQLKIPCPMARRDANLYWMGSIA